MNLHVATEEESNILLEREDKESRENLALQLQVTGYNEEERLAGSEPKLSRAKIITRYMEKMILQVLFNIQNGPLQCLGHRVNTEENA